MQWYCGSARGDANWCQWCPRAGTSIPVHADEEREAGHRQILEEVAGVAKLDIDREVPALRDLVADGRADGAADTGVDDVGVPGVRVSEEAEAAADLDPDLRRRPVLQ